MQQRASGTKLFGFRDLREDQQGVQICPHVVLRTTWTLIKGGSEVHPLHLDVKELYWQLRICKTDISNVDSGSAHSLEPPRNELGPLWFIGLAIYHRCFLGS